MFKNAIRLCCPRAMVLMLAVTPLIVFATACGSMPASEPMLTNTPAVTPVPKLTSTPTITPTPKPTDMPTLTPTPEPAGTPTSSPEILVPTARTLCEAAFPSSVVTGLPLFPALYLLSIEYKYEENGWAILKGGQFGDLPRRAQSASEVKTLACIKQGRVKTGTYTDGAVAYRIDWDVRLVNWPDGEVLVAKTFSGDEPLGVKSGSGDRYGSQPIEAFASWITSLGNKTVLFHDDLSSIAFSPDGKTLVSGSQNGTVILWDVATGQEIRAFSGYTGILKSIAFSPDGKTLVAGGSDYAYGKNVMLWNVATGQVVYTLWEETTTVAFSPDGKTLAWGVSVYGVAYKVTLWDLTAEKMVHELLGHTLGVLSIAFSPDGQLLASGSGDKTVKLWDVATGQEVRTFSGHEAGVTSVAFSPDGKTLASGSGDSTVILWDVATGQ